jgi:hypothetical protein
MTWCACLCLADEVIVMDPPLDDSPYHTVQHPPPLPLDPHITIISFIQHSNQYPQEPKIEPMVFI